MRYLKYLVMGGVLLMALQGCSTSGWYHLPAVEFKDIDYGYTAHNSAVRNINVAYIDEGQGDQVLLLIHGLGSNAKAWNLNIPELAKEHRVIAVDLPGYGKSDKGYYEYSLEFYAEVLTEFLTGLGIDKATYVGHSMGGQIAMITALNYPKKVEGIVLISPAGFEKFTNGEGDWLRKVLSPQLVEDTTIQNIAVNLQSNFYDMPETAEFMITDRIQVRGTKDFKRYCYAVSQNVGAMIDAPVLERFDAIKQPTLILFGENDDLIPNRFLHGGFTRDYATAGAELFPNAKLQLIPKCGHFVQFEKPVETNSAMLEFLSGL